MSIIATVASVLIALDVVAGALAGFLVYNNMFQILLAVIAVSFPVFSIFAIIFAHRQTGNNNRVALFWVWSPFVIFAIFVSIVLYLMFK